MDTPVLFDPVLASNNACGTLGPNPPKLPGIVVPTVASSVVAPYPHDNNTPSNHNTINSISLTLNDKQIVVTQDKVIHLNIKPPLSRQVACDAVQSLKPEKLTDQLTSLPLIDNHDYESFEEFYSYILDHLQHPLSSDFFITPSDWLDDFLKADADTEVSWNCIETMNLSLIEKQSNY